MDALQKIAQMGFPFHGTPEEFTVIHHSGSGVVARYEETGKKCGFFTVRVGADRGLDKRAARAVEEHCESRARASCAKGVLLTYSFGNPNKNNFPKFQKIRKIGDAQYEYEILEIVPKSYERLCENYNALFEAAKKIKEEARTSFSPVYFLEDVAFHYKGADGCFSVEELEEGYALAERKTGNAVPFESAEKAEIALRTLLEEAFRKQRLKLALKPSMHFFNKKFGKEIRSEARDDLRRALLNKYGKTEIEKRLSQWEWNGKRIELHGADITAFSIDDVYFIVESGTGVKSPKLHQAEDERALKEIADSIVQKQAEQMRKQALEVFGIGERTR